MDKLLFATVLGLLIGVADILPMIFQRLPRYSTAAAFVQYFVATVVIVFIDLPYVPWWLQGGLVSLAMIAPMLIHVGHTDRKPLPVIATNALVLGTLVSVITHYMQDYIS